MSNPENTVETIGRWWSVNQVAKALNVHARTVRRWCAAGILPSVKIGSCLRVADSDLRQFLERVKREAEAVRAGQEPGAFAQRAADLSRDPEAVREEAEA